MRGELPLPRRFGGLGHAHRLRGLAAAALVAIGAGALAAAAAVGGRAAQPDAVRTADLSSKAVVVVTLVDTKGHALSGIPVSLACTQSSGPGGGGGSSHAIVTAESALTDAGGHERFDVTDGVPGYVTCLASAATPVDANVPGIVTSHRLDQSVTIRFTPLSGRSADPLDAHASTVTVSPAAVPANLSSKASVTVTLEDTHGHPMGGVPVSLLCVPQGKAGGAQAAQHAVVTPGGAQSDQHGTARFQVADGVPGFISCLASAATPSDANVPGLLTSHRLDQDAPIRFTALSGRTADPIDTKGSTATVSPAQIPADLTSKAVVTVTLKDTKSHRLTGVPVSLACLQRAGAGGGGSSGSHAVVTPPGTQSDHFGTTRFAITDGVPGFLTCIVNADTPTDPNVPGILDRHRLDQTVELRLTTLTGRTTDSVDTHNSTVVVEGAAATLPKGGSDWAVDARAFRGKNGTHIDYTCPPNGTRGEVWGSNPYSDQSSVCTAAVNFGLITVAKGGDVTIEISAGRKSYTGSNRNGTTTGNFGSWDGSFVFAGTPKVFSEAGYAGVGWGNSTFAYRGQNGKQVVYACPPNPGIDLTKVNNLYGTDTYTEGSPVCQAAVHAGLIDTTTGGDVTVQIAPGLRSYTGSKRNGITSQSAGPAPASFIFVKS